MAEALGMEVEEGEGIEGKEGGGVTLRALGDLEFLTLLHLHPQRFCQYFCRFLLGARRLYI